MSAHAIPSLPRPPPTAHLLCLPPEILQSIYLFSLSPSLPDASPVLANALSTDLIYKLTFLHAFWNITPLVFVGQPAQQTDQPGPHVQSLFQPLPVPRVNKSNTTARVKLQETVLGYRWCTFPRAKLYFSSILKAISQDLFQTFQIPLSPHHKPLFESFIAHIPAKRSIFDTTALDSSRITLDYPRRFATAILMTYDGPNTHFKQRTSPNLTITPTKILTIPSHILSGQTEWTEEKMDFLRMLCSHINLRTVQYSLPAFHAGIKNAIIQQNPNTLLLLLWQMDRLAEHKKTSVNDASPFELPGELFQLVARRGTQYLAQRGYHSSETTIEDSSVFIKLFTLLLRAHAESMPQHDPAITTWAQRLLACQHSSESERDRAFAQWVLDWGSQERSSEVVVDRCTGRRGVFMKVQPPLFRAGGVSRRRRGEEMVKRFVELCGGQVERFGEEVEGIWRAYGRQGG